MIEPVELSRLFARKIAADTEVDTYCKENFGSSLKVMLGVDAKNPPGRADTPFAVVLSGVAQEGDEASTFSYVVSVDWVIENADSEASEGVTEMKGVGLSDGLGRLIIEAMRGASANIALSNWTYEVEHVEFFPMFMASISVTVNVPHLIGGAVTL